MIAGNLQSILEKLPSGVQLVAVSKFHPVEQIREAYAAGQRVFAESRPQELAAKVPQMPADVQWHFIGHLQTNKLKLVLPYVSLVQSVDSIHLLEAINNWALINGRVVDVLLELHLGAEETKQGFTEDEILDMMEDEPDGELEEGADRGAVQENSGYGVPQFHGTVHRDVRGLACGGPSRGHHGADRHRYFRPAGIRYPGGLLHSKRMIIFVSQALTYESEQRYHPPFLSLVFQ